MNNELVEAVARLYEKKWGVRDYLLALDVIALIRPATLEEAAKVADETITQDQCVAAAIRALKDKG